ncbi:MAG: 50S ribosomal protein L25 [Firmicutes bacterium]|nr:50S ribosomal protein L25 [Bacillota bacterium]
MELVLQAETRTERGTGAAPKLRGAGFIPAVVYARGFHETIKVSRRELERLVAHGGTSRLLKLAIQRGKKVEEQPVLIKELQRDPVKEDIIHVDFQAVAMDQPVTTEVPVRLVGAEKRHKEGVLIELLLHALSISCLPNAIPEAITVDITNLPVGESLHVRDLTPPAGVKILTPADEVVVTIALPAGVEEVTPTGEAAEPELVTEKKEE